MNLKQSIEKKLGDALFELKYRCREQSSNLSAIQRMYGVCLGLRIALMQCDLDNPYQFKHSNEVEHLVREGFGQLKLKDIRQFEFKEV
jgi:hypothetical protein